MHRYRFIALVWAAVLLAGCYINPQLSGEITAESTESQTLAVGEAPTIEITNPVGQIEITEGAPGEVSATITKQSRHEDPAEAEGLLDQITWTLTQTGDGVRLLIEGTENTDNFESGLSAVAMVQVPPGSDLVVNLGAGETSIDQPTGDVVYNGGAGLVTVSLPRDASFTLHITGGVASIESDFAGVPRADSRLISPKPSVITRRRHLS
jgi:hypothetical protein